MNRSDTDSYITKAKRDHWCKLCSEPIRTGEDQLMYAQGKCSWLSMHVECARTRQRYDCQALRNTVSESV